MRPRGLTSLTERLLWLWIRADVWLYLKTQQVIGRMRNV